MRALRYFADQTIIPSAATRVATLCGETMKVQSIQPTGVERFFGEDEIIVSKTDTTGRITYANRIFLDVAGYTEAEVLGQQHNLIRHPDMPRCVFKYLWDVVEGGSEIFAYVVNQCKNGDHYWVFAHVTPTFNESGTITGYHSNRRVPEKSAVEAISGVYQLLRAEEEKHKDPRKGLLASYDMFLKYLESKGTDYDEMIFSL